MSVNSPSNLKSRLRVVPIDEWSTREKLCLASSVLKSGDQNWSSVSRPMKSFCEPNRPQDWYHQKYCAIQYQELLEKIETDTPKRKRSERGEETPQTVIVRNLTKQRIEELRQKTQMEREMIARVKRDLELLKTNQMDDKRVQELCSEIKEKEAKEKEREVEHKKWLEERNVKIAQMTRKGTFATRHKPSTPAMPVPSQTIANATVAESAVKSPLIEPLKVEVESDGNITQSTAQKQTVEKPAPVTPSPSTSPLLTSLLQSPTPSTPTLLSPTKSGLTNPFNRQKSSSPLTPISRRPSIHSTPEKTTESPLKSSDKNDLTVGNSTPSKSDVSAESGAQNESKTAVESSKLSKLLESPNTVKPKTTTTEVKALESKTQIMVSNKESKQTPEKCDQLNTSGTTSEEKRTISSKNKTKDSKKDSEKGEEVHKREESNERSLRSKDKTDESKGDKHLAEKTDDKEREKSVEKKPEETAENVSIKQEIMDALADEESQHKESGKPVVKEEPMDSTSSSVAEDSNQRTPLTRPNKRVRKTLTPLNITPTVTRRSSRRVALKDTKSANDDSTEVSDQSAANTPQAVKKRGSVDDTTETSMSEESMDAKMPATSASNDTIPNSPASVRTEDMKESDSKEYKTWKKAVMVNWRLISAHKNASLFSHPVTETEAKGYEEIVRRPMDLNSIKKRVEGGVVRTTIEYQRDILLMFQNAIMFNNANHDVHKMAVDMQKDTIASIEDFIANIDTKKQDNQSSNDSKLRDRGRRSNAPIIATPVGPENEMSIRRKSRGASTDTDSNASSLTKSVTKKKKT